MRSRSIGLLVLLAACASSPTEALDASHPASPDAAEAPAAAAFQALLQDPPQRADATQAATPEPHGPRHDH